MITHSPQRGFSLMTVIIAVTITGILGAMIIPNLISYLGVA